MQINNLTTWVAIPGEPQFLRVFNMTSCKSAADGPVSYQWVRRRTVNQNPPPDRRKPDLPAQHKKEKRHDQ